MDAGLQLKHEAERLALQMHQGLEMEALLESSVERDTFCVGQRVVLEVDGGVIGGVMTGGPHFDSSVNVRTDAGELHLYCEIHRVNSAFRPRRASIASSNGLSSLESSLGSRKGSLNCMLTRSRRNSECDTSHTVPISFLGHASTTEQPSVHATQKGGRPPAYRRRNSFKAPVYDLEALRREI